MTDEKPRLTHVAPDEFRAYVDGLDLSRNFPGLLGLGYSEKEALAAVKNLPSGLAVTEGIRAALKALAKS